MTGKKERKSRFGGMGSVLAQHRLLDAALGPGEGAVDASEAEAGGAAAPEATPAASPLAEEPTTTESAPVPASDASRPRVDEAADTDAKPKARPRSTRTAAPAPNARAAEPVLHQEPGPVRAVTAGPVVERSVDEIRPSPFQPQGRPSRGAVEAVGRAIADAGSLDALVNSEGAVVFARLSTEAARLAELAFDISTHGVKDPIVTRVAEDEAEECLSGHRRLAAARLAGLPTVPVLSRGPMSNANAAATVLSGNLHREPFTTWQEAVLVSEVRERRIAEQMPADVRTLSRVMGWASGKAQARLKLRRTLSDAVLDQLGDASLVERIGRLGTKELNRIADAPDDARRLALLRRALGVAEPTGARAAESSDGVATQRPRRGGGFVLEVRQEIESMPLGDLAIVQALLDAQLSRVNTRMRALGRSV